MYTSVHVYKCVKGSKILREKEREIDYQTKLNSDSVCYIVIQRVYRYIVHGFYHGASAMTINCIQVYFGEILRTCRPTDEEHIKIKLGYGLSDFKLA